MRALTAVGLVRAAAARHVRAVVAVAIGRGGRERLCWLAIKRILGYDTAGQIRSQIVAWLISAPLL
jgi:hypothetical protein